jgi:hypothetical protein
MQLSEADVRSPSDVAVADPTRPSRFAIASGYFGIIPFTWTFFIFPYAHSKYPPWIGGKWIAISAVLAWLIAILPTMSLAILGHIMIRRDKGLRGTGHVWFAYVSCAMLLGVQVTALVLQGLRK